jgi:hypothetical protein
MKQERRNFVKWKFEMRFAVSVQTLTPKYFINAFLRNKYRCSSLFTCRRKVKSLTSLDWQQNRVITPHTGEMNCPMTDTDFAERSLRFIKINQPPQCVIYYLQPFWSTQKGCCFCVRVFIPFPHSNTIYQTHIPLRIFSHISLQLSDRSFLYFPQICWNDKYDFCHVIDRVTDVNSCTVHRLSVPGPPVTPQFGETCPIWFTKQVKIRVSYFTLPLFLFSSLSIQKFPQEVKLTRKCAVFLLQVVLDVAEGTEFRQPCKMTCSTVTDIMVIRKFGYKIKISAAQVRFRIVVWFVWRNKTVLSPPNKLTVPLEWKGDQTKRTATLFHCGAGSGCGVVRRSVDS